MAKATYKRECVIWGLGVAELESMPITVANTAAGRQAAGVVLGQ